ncbi:MAG: CBS domain-containing protein [Pseudomonadales bacterium]|nr:CBS domain-containing protein [Pseudomonadales bacterium]
MKSLLVRDYMQTRTVSISCGTAVDEVVKTLLKYELRGVPVVDEGKKVIGFVSEQDCIRQLLSSSYHREGIIAVDEVMHHGAVCVSPNDSILDLAGKMSTGSNPKRYPVVENGKLVGIITRREVLQGLVDHSRK